MKKLSELSPATVDDAMSVFEFARKAELFLAKKPWCKSIVCGYMARAWDGILGVFYFEIVPSSSEIDRSVWVIAGDVPTAYICNDSKVWSDALGAYVAEMTRWVDAVRTGEPIDMLIPTGVPPSISYANMLASRLQFIRTELLKSDLGSTAERDDRIDRRGPSAEKGET